MIYFKLNIQRFATNLVTNTLTETSYSVETNSSQVRYLVQLKTSGDSYNSNNITTSYTIDGVSYTNTHKLPKSSTTTIVDKTVTIYHNDDGTRSVAASFRCPTGISAGTITGTQNLVLTTIPRASKPTTSSECELGSNVTIYTNRASNYFTHTINTYIGNTKIETFNNIGDSKSWTPSVASYAPYITESESATCVIECITYKDGVQIGSAQNATISLKVPASIKPSVNISAVENDATMLSLNWGIYVQGKSKLAVTVSGTPSYGSAIKSYNTRIGSINYSSQSFVSNVLTESGTVVTNVTDKRNHTSNNATISYSVVNYSNPQINNTSVVRCDSDGNENDQGTCIKYVFKGNISPVNNLNYKKFRLGYKLSTANSYTYIDLVDNAYSINHDGIVINNITFDTNYSYDFSFEALDSFTNSSIVKSIGTGYDLINFNSSGKSIAFGTVSSALPNEEKMEINFPDGVYINGNKCFANSEYSTIEKIIGVWVDGKPVYRKTIYISALPNNATEEYLTNISNIDRVINMYGQYQGYVSGVFTTRPLEFSITSAAEIHTYIGSGNKLKIRTTDNLSAFDGYVTLEYTKTTD